MESLYRRYWQTTANGRKSGKTVMEALSLFRLPLLLLLTFLMGHAPDSPFSCSCFCAYQNKASRRHPSISFTSSISSEVKRSRSSACDPVSDIQPKKKKLRVRSFSGRNINILPRVIASISASSFCIHFCIQSTDSKPCSDSFQLGFFFLGYT